MPDTLVYWENKSDEVLKISNNKKDKLVLVDYLSSQEKFDKILYKTNPKTVNDLKANAELITIFTKENYAKDKNNKKL